MTTTQAKRLGALIARARISKGLSTRALADRVGLSATWISGVESGRFAEPAADRLARLAEALDIAARRMNEISRGAVADNLPSMRTYFRAKYALSPEQIEQVERYVRRLRGPS